MGQLRSHSRLGMPHDERESRLEALSQCPPSLDGAIEGRGFYRRTGKQLFDVIGATCALILLAPLLVVLGILVKVTSRGSVFFRQERVGKNGKVFSLVKFRSMSPVAHEKALPITASGDPRITTFGALLRRYKLDELPQLWNVLKGEMSFVGPRPELPTYVAIYPGRERNTLSVRPGITDPASIAFRHEEELLGSVADPEEFYRNTVLPHKLSMNLEYVEQMSFTLDVRLILRTLRSVLQSSPDKGPGIPGAEQRRPARESTPGVSPPMEKPR
jgi:lipopolysaccharide/colanic/teichoic acid biosynthesis glycosyltransferase